MKNNTLSFGDNVENMNRTWKSIVLIISLMGCVSALDGNGLQMRPGEATAEKLFNHGIGEPWVGGNPPSYSASDSIYSQYYSMYTGPVTKKHIESPKKHVIKDKTPTTVYFSYQMQAMPYTQYQNLCHIYRRQLTVDTRVHKLDSVCQSSSRIKLVFISNLFYGRQRIPL